MEKHKGIFIARYQEFWKKTLRTFCPLDCVCCGREKKTFNLRMSLMGCKNIERKNDQKYRKEKIMTGQKKK